MAASENLDAAVAREEAAIAAEEDTLARIHTRIQEQRDLIATLRGQVSAGNAAAQATIQQLDTLSSRIEADTAAAESDTTEPPPTWPPAPAPPNHHASFPFPTSSTHPSRATVPCRSPTPRSRPAPRA
jgi:uncharacterized coiled-coil protein SlyX